MAPSGMLRLVDLVRTDFVFLLAGPMKPNNDYAGQQTKLIVPDAHPWPQRALFLSTKCHKTLSRPNTASPHQAQIVTNDKVNTSFPM
jgi:hypothetical protein